MKFFKVTSILTLPSSEKRQICTYVQARTKHDVQRLAYVHLKKHWPEATNIEIDPFFIDELIVVKDEMAA